MKAPRISRPLLGPDGYVLEVRIVRAQSACGGAGLLVVCMYTTIDGAYHLRQRIDVGVAKLFVFAIFEYLLCDLMILGKFQKNIFTRRILTGLCLLGFIEQLHFFEEDLSELLR